MLVFFDQRRHIVHPAVIALAGRETPYSRSTIAMKERTASESQDSRLFIRALNAAGINCQHFVQFSVEGVAVHRGHVKKGCISSYRKQQSLSVIRSEEHTSELQ